MKKCMNKNNRSARVIKAATSTQPSKITTPISFNEEMTLRELLTLISSTAGVTAPSMSALRDSGKPVAVYGSTDYSIEVYKNGFALVLSWKRHSVFRVDRCKDYHYDTQHEELAKAKKSAAKPDITFEDFLDLPWTVRLILTAEDKLEENNDLAARRAISEHPQVAAEVQQYNRWLHGESVENQVFDRMMKEEMLDRLTDKQKEVMILYYREGYTQAEIAEMLGISTVAVKNRLDGAVQKIRRNFTEGVN